MDEHPPQSPVGHRIARIKGSVEIRLHHAQQILWRQPLGAGNGDHGAHPVIGRICNNHHWNVLNGELQGRPLGDHVGVNHFDNRGQTFKGHGTLGWLRNLLGKGGCGPQYQGENSGADHGRLSFWYMGPA